MYGGECDGVMNVWRRVRQSDECMEESVPEMVIECFACFTLLMHNGIVLCTRSGCTTLCDDIVMLKFCLPIRLFCTVFLHCLFDVGKQRFTYCCNIAIVSDWLSCLAFLSPVLFSFHITHSSASFDVPSWCCVYFAG